MFKSARIKITGVYLLIIMLITFTFSSFVYVNVTRFAQRALEMHERRIETRLGEFRRPEKLPPGFQKPVSEETITQIKINTIYLLIVLNTLVLLVSGGIAYWFAGKTLEPIEGMTNKQKQFIADATHELKTPLTAMKTYLEVNKRSKKLDTEKMHEIIDSTIEDVDSLTRLTNNLLKQSKYQEYATSQEYETFELNQVINKVLKKLKSKSDTKGLVVSTDLTTINIKANKQSITELISILVDNAIKFNNKGGSIYIKTEQENKHILITIKDTGIGIPQKDLPHIFDRFYKVDLARTKTEHDGFGLGLSIAKDIVQNHEGAISVESKTNEGTTFCIKLPHNI